MNKDVAGRGEKVRNQPLATVAMIMEVTAQQDAQHKGQQDLPGQADFQIFHRN